MSNVIFLCVRVCVKDHRVNAYSILCLMAPACCVFNAACDLWSVLCVLRGLREEALLDWDNRIWSRGSPLGGGRCVLTSLPLFTVHFLSACVLLFNAITHPQPGPHLLPLCCPWVRQLMVKLTRPAGMEVYARVTIWGEMKSYGYCEESTTGTGAACVWSLWWGWKVPVSQTQLVNLSIIDKRLTFWKHRSAEFVTSLITC